jgi:hypothetical protein
MSIPENSDLLVVATRSELLGVNRLKSRVSGLLIRLISMIAAAFEPALLA